MAAMLLGMDEEGKTDVPDGSTVMDIPTPQIGGQPGDTKSDDANKKKVTSREDMTNAASDLLRKDAPPEVTTPAPRASALGGKTAHGRSLRSSSPEAACSRGVAQGRP